MALARAGSAQQHINVQPRPEFSTHAGGVVSSAASWAVDPELAHLHDALTGDAKATCLPRCNGKAVGPSHDDSGSTHVFSCWGHFSSVRPLLLAHLCVGVCWHCAAHVSWCVTRCGLCG